MKHFTRLTLGILALCAGCETTVVTTEEPLSAVVAGFLVAGENTLQIRLTSTIPYDTVENPAVYLADAQPVLTIASQSYPLTYTDSGYFELRGVPLTAGDSCQLYFTFGDQVVSAAAKVPPKPEGLTLSTSKVYMYRIEEGSFDIEALQANMEQDPVEISWSQPGDAWFVVSVQNTAAEIDWVSTLRRPGDSTLYTRLSEAEISSSLALQAGFELQQFGRYRVIVYRVNPEYAAMLLDTGGDGFTLEEPVTNIVNGKGLFTCLNSDTAYFEVIER
ncbi:MAG: DUF4249 family protein [Bacteroidia bacterium]|nr:DUF4249 family protein [Bacteroidia bacterium]